jgi:hypothetical protein
MIEKVQCKYCNRIYFYVKNSGDDLLEICKHPLLSRKNTFCMVRPIK